MAGVEWVTLTGRLTRSDNQPATGYVQVRLLEQLPNPDGDEVLSTQPTTIRLVDGAFSTPVPATSVGEPALWIVVDILLDDTPPGQMVFTVDGTQDPVDLADVTPVVVVPDSDGHTVAVPVEWIGRAGGVAPLDSARKVPAEFLPGSVGAGMISWWQGDGPPPLAIPGAAPGDMYYDRIGNHFHQLR